MPLPAQTNSNAWPGTFFSGYETTIRGGGFSYHSPNPHVTNSMLVRSSDSSAYVEWATQKVPEDFSAKDAYFVWMFGINVTPDGHLFSLYANGKKVLVFGNPDASKKVNWTVSGSGGAELTFIPTMIDQYNDLMGYAVLKLPAADLEQGKEQTLRIHGQDAGSPVWYMTFEAPVKKEIKISQVPAIAREGGKSYDLAAFSITHLGGDVSAVISLDNGMKRTVRIQPGYNSLLLRIPEVERQEKFTARVKMAGRDIEKTFVLKPVPKWTVYLVEHTHTDVGYPEPQHEIMPEQLRYIDYALDYCDATDNYPNDAKFRWTCETAWAVQEYLRTRPKFQVERLLRRIKQGRIEVTGLYVNMSDLYDESCLSDLLRTVSYFKKEGIDVKTAMQDDVNGAAWCLVDYLSSAGFKYFTMGENPTHAQRPFDKPTAFWWESPSGNKILAFRGEHYQYANGLGILSGDVNGFGNSLFRYLNSLKKKDYPFTRAMLQFSGYFIDDSPPSIVACNLVRKWNEKFEWPKLKLATISEFFNSIDKHYGAKLPVYRLAWPDWWTDGAGSCALETAYVRDTQSSFIANQGLYSMAALLGAPVKPDALRSMNSINDNLAFFDEHTFGAAESISNPLSLNTTVQWNEKSAYAWAAVKDNGVLREAALGLLRPFVSKTSFTTVTVFNTMNYERSGTARFFAYGHILPPGKEITMVDARGNDVPIQTDGSGPGGNYWKFFAADVPAFGYRTYRVIVHDGPPAEIAERLFDGTIENKYYKIVIDTVKGGITSVLDRSDGKQLVDAKAPWELGQFIYERLSDSRLMDGPNSLPYNPDLFTRTSMTDVRFGKVVDEPLWKSIDITGRVKGCADSNGVTCELRLFKQEKRIQFVFSMTKMQVFKPEAAYVAFPFESPGGQISFEVQGGTVVPGKGQLPGSASDWDGVQNFATVRNSSGQIVFVSPQAPLMEFGDINTGKWQRVDRVTRPYIYSYVLNNYWDTNFRAAQEGGLLWKYDITSSSDTSMQFATRFGWSSRAPLTATVRLGDGTGTSLTSRSILDFGRSGLLLVFARPAWNGKGVVLCLRETDGKPATLDVSKLVSSDTHELVYEVNSLEENSKRVTGQIEFRPYEVRFLLLKPAH